MTPDDDDRLMFAMIEVVGAAQRWRRSLIPKTSTASQRAVENLCAALDVMDDAAGFSSPARDGSSAPPAG